MHMHDWNAYRQQLTDGILSLAKLSPDAVKGYVTLSGASQKTGHIDAKTRELIALAVAISLRCDGCIAVHSAAARKNGATRKRSPRLSQSLSVSTQALPWFTPPVRLTHSIPSKKVEVKLASG